MAAMTDHDSTPVYAANRAMDLAVQEALDYVRRSHCVRWSYIGQDPETGAWRASRDIRPGVSHHVVCRALGELDRELNAIEAGDDGVTE